ncbi:DUF6283 family protein [Streptomyces rubiginosohelvolus]
MPQQGSTFPRLAAARGPRGTTETTVADRNRTRVRPVRDPGLRVLPRPRSLFGEPTGRGEQYRPPPAPSHGSPTMNIPTTPPAVQRMVQPPAPRPCASCPYRLDVPSGIWSEDDYNKLPLYDEPTWAQPPQLFLCHQRDRNDDRARVCGGWASCHDGDHLLALRIASLAGQITAETAEAIRGYISPVGLFVSGAQAAAHGLRELLNPGPKARRAIDKLRRTRADLT